MGVFTDQFWRAIADYGVKFGTLSSLGAGNPPAEWLKEYERVRRTAFAAVLLTNNSGEGASAGGQRNFPQEILADALHCRRYDLDNTYVLPAHLYSYPEAVAARRRAGRGRVLKFSSC